MAERARGGAHLAVGVEAVRHELVAVELGGRLGELAALADLGRHGALLQGCHALPPVHRVRRKASLAVVVQAVRVGLVAVELAGLLEGVAAPAFLASHSRLLRNIHRNARTRYFNVSQHAVAALNSPSAAMMRLTWETLRRHPLLWR